MPSAKRKYKYVDGKNVKGVYYKGENRGRHRLRSDKKKEQTEVKRPKSEKKPQKKKSDNKPHISHERDWERLITGNLESEKSQVKKGRQRIRNKNANPYY